MEPRKHELKDGRILLIREGAVEDASALLDYLYEVSGETDFLTFGPGEREATVSDEEAHIVKSQAADNQLFLVALIDETIVSVLNFTGGQRPRIQHNGEFGLTVRKPYWGLGIGGLMMDALIDWARATQIVKKINLRVRPNNTRAIRLYERKGFVIEGTISRDIFLDGNFYDNHWMGLEL